MESSKPWIVIAVIILLFIKFTDIEKSKRNTSENFSVGRTVKNISRNMANLAGAAAGSKAAGALTSVKNVNVGGVGKAVGNSADILGGTTKAAGTLSGTTKAVGNVGGVKAVGSVGGTKAPPPPPPPPISGKPGGNIGGTVAAPAPRATPSGPKLGTTPSGPGKIGGPTAPAKIAPPTKVAPPTKMGSPSKVDTGKADTGKADTGKVDTGKVDTGKVDTGKADAGKVDTGKADAGKADTGKVDTGKADAGKADTGKADADAKADGGKADADAKVDAPPSKAKMAAKALVAAGATGAFLWWFLDEEEKDDTSEEEDLHEMCLGLEDPEHRIQCLHLLCINEEEQTYEDETDHATIEKNPIHECLKKNCDEVFENNRSAEGYDQCLRDGCGYADISEYPCETMICHARDPDGRDRCLEQSCLRELAREVAPILEGEDAEELAGVDPDMLPLITVAERDGIDNPEMYCLNLSCQRHSDTNSSQRCFLSRCDEMDGKKKDECIKQMCDISPTFTQAQNCYSSQCKELPKEKRGDCLKNMCEYLGEAGGEKEDIENCNKYIEELRESWELEERRKETVNETVTKGLDGLSDLMTNFTWLGFQSWIGENPAVGSVLILSIILCLICCILLLRKLTSGRSRRPVYY